MWSIVAERNGCDGCCAVAARAVASQMSVVSLARTAGVTWLLSNSRSLIVSTSFELALIEHDIHQPLGDDLAHQLAKLVERAEAGLAGVVLGRCGPARTARTPCRRPWRRPG